MDEIRNIIKHRYSLFIDLYEKLALFIRLLMYFHKFLGRQANQNAQSQ